VCKLTTSNAPWRRSFSRRHYQRQSSVQSSSRCPPGSATHHALRCVVPDSEFPPSAVVQTHATPRYLHTGLHSVISTLGTNWQKSTRLVPDWVKKRRMTWEISCNYLPFRLTSSQMKTLRESCFAASFDNASISVNHQHSQTQTQCSVNFYTNIWWIWIWSVARVVTQSCRVYLGPIGV